MPALHVLSMKGNNLKFVALQGAQVRQGQEEAFHRRTILFRELPAGDECGSPDDVMEVEEEIIL